MPNSQKKNASIVEQEEKEKRLIIIISFSVIALITVAIFSALLISRLRLIRNQKQIIERQKELVEARNKDVTDSINYARKIQTAMLPAADDFAGLFPKNFIFYNPRNIVSGDFYWCAERDGKKYIAVADCTGHGVPGALMSMIGMNLLHQLIAEPETKSVGGLLGALNKEVVKALKQQQKDTETRDGMDIALVEIDETKKTISYAGANRPVYYLNEKELMEFQPSKFPIGGSMYTNELFDEQQFQYERGHRLFLSTDGYTDQFGGAKGKKFMSKNLKILLESGRTKSISEQGNDVISTFNTWKNNYEQVDDVCIIGIEL